jgi:hypothetical protein
MNSDFKGYNGDCLLAGFSAWKGREKTELTQRREAAKSGLEVTKQEQSRLNTS